MAKNPFQTPKLPGLPGVSNKLPSDRPLNPKPNLVGSEQPVNPEARRMRFRKLAALLGGLHAQTGVANPPPVIPPIGPKVPKF